MRSGTLILMCLIPVIALVSMWWWALFGLDAEIGMALMVTSLCIFAVALGWDLS